MSEFCCDLMEKYFEFGAFEKLTNLSIIILNMKTNNLVESARISYCPFCGEKLIP